MKELREIDVRGILYSDVDPEEHRVGDFPAKSEYCPPLWRFPLAVKTGWHSNDEGHVHDCHYCQRTIALTWRIECPGWTALGEYIAHQRDREAMEWHLHGDCCELCRLRLGVQKLKEYARALAAGLPETAAQQWKELWGKVREIQLNIPSRPLVPAFGPPVSAFGLARGGPPSTLNEETTTSEIAEAHIRRSPGQMWVSLARIDPGVGTGELVVPGLDRTIPFELERGAMDVELHGGDLDRVESKPALAVLFPRE